MNFIAYKTRLTPYAQENRRAPTPAEKKLWYDLLRDRPLGYKFIRQKPLLHYIADFYCSKLLLVVEVDGGYHSERKEYDEQRSNDLKELGIKVIRYNNNEVLENIEGVYEDFIQNINKRNIELKKV